MDTSRYAALFLSDSREHLQQCDALLLAWERQPAQLEPVTGIFRAMHTIKGMAATMGYARLAALTHDAEHLLDAVRSGRVVPTAELVALLFEVVDAIGTGVEDAVGGLDGQRLDPTLAQRLAAFAGQEAGPAADPPAPAADPATGAGPAGAGRRVTVTIRPGVVMGWARAMVALRRAEELGVVSEVTPDPRTLDPERFAGRLAFRLVSDRPTVEVRQALAEVGEVAEVHVDEATGAAGGMPGRVRQDVRVDREQLDRLRAEVGELVIARNRLASLADDRRDPELGELVSRLSRLTDQVHDRVMRARMVPVAEGFDRFPRAIRDLARQVGKEVRLIVTGREIEVDRSVLESIQDPLLHLLRNAVDHGLESAAERALAGKRPEGEIRLEAAREREAVVIMVSDDGRGVDADRIRARLRAEGADPGPLDGAALLAVLGRPGFSTATEVTSVSGRGVGIDVVLSRIREVGGVVTMESRVGQGTRFEIRLPASMAVVPALLATAGPDRYAFPLSRVHETGRGEAAADRSGGALIVPFRGDRLPALDLRAAVGIPGTPAPGPRPFLVVGEAERRRAVLVDTLVGRQDLVVEPVALPAGAPGWIAGAAVLPDGVPALLLDPGGLFQEESAWPK